ncbi:hypothetical protein FIBSPDRAFT_937117 [Athelia psychrophila]|uniref:Uncharacterized protein n=1 Tax=Athelia psychrophila TaxID=1759441 RepID=A0A166AZ08_9AGAM|nr:hypothetical protein FIBSPDRAFT_937117 [Fibularhizoctonia sp. CBS 109695]
MSVIGALLAKYKRPQTSNDLVPQLRVTSFNVKLLPFTVYTSHISGGYPVSKFLFVVSHDHPSQMTSFLNVKFLSKDAQVRTDLRESSAEAYLQLHSPISHNTYHTHPSPRRPETYQTPAPARQSPSSRIYIYKAERYIRSWVV